MQVGMISWDAVMAEVWCTKHGDPNLLNTVELFLLLYLLWQKQHPAGTNAGGPGKGRKPALHEPHCLEWLFFLILCQTSFADARATARATGAIWVRGVLGVPGILRLLQVSGVLGSWRGYMMHVDP